MFTCVAWKFWQNSLPVYANSVADILHCAWKTKSLHYRITGYYNTWNVQPFNMKMLTEDMLHPLVQQTFKMESLSWTQAEKHGLSPFINRLINSCLLQSYNRWHCTQLLHQMLFQLFKKLFKLVHFYPFVANSFTNLFAPKLLNSILIVFFLNLLLIAQTHFLD